MPIVSAVSIVFTRPLLLSNSREGKIKVKNKKSGMSI